MAEIYDVFKRDVAVALENQFNFCQHPFTRHACYCDLEGCLSESDHSNKCCLSVSDSVELARIAGLQTSQITNGHYPEVDMGALPYADAAFDFCVSDFVIEHAEADPLTLFKEQTRVLKPGGFVVCTTAFVYQYHPCPDDFWRFSKSTFRFLSEKCGLDVIKCGSWGSIECLIAIELGHSADRVPRDENNYVFRMANSSDERYQIVTWLVARKK